MALKMAQIAAQKNEVPVGAVLIGPQGEILSKAYNLRENLKTPLGHAELLALHRAAQKLNSWRLLNSTLYVTLEPCVMCAGALVQARISRLVFAATDPKAGGILSLYQIAEDTRLNHQIQVQGGLLADEAKELLQKFFRRRRLENQKLKS